MWPGQDFNLHESGTSLREQVDAPVMEVGARIGNLPRSFMDEARSEAQDDQPRQGALGRVRAATTPDARARNMGDSQGRPKGRFYATDVHEDPKNRNRCALYVGLAGLGLHDRDDYPAEGLAPVRKAYRDSLGQEPAVIGWLDAQLAASTRGRGNCASPACIDREWSRAKPTRSTTP